MNKNKTFNKGDFMDSTNMNDGEAMNEKPGTLSSRGKDVEVKENQWAYCDECGHVEKSEDAQSYYNCPNCDSSLIRPYIIVAEKPEYYYPGN